MPGGLQPHSSMTRPAGIKDRPFVVVKDLSKRYGPNWALARATFGVDRGELALLTGANGSGKTTLIRCLSTGLIPDFGRASIGGSDLVGDREQVRRRVAGLSVPAGVYGGLSARENLALVDSVLGLSKASSIDAALDRVGLTAKKDAPLDSYSAGMKQRFALARLLLLERDLILLDEPETHLDGLGLKLLQELIAEWKARGAAILCATHSPDRFEGVTSLVVRLVEGRAA